jgi:hypothetical protein
MPPDAEAYHCGVPQPVLKWISRTVRRKAGLRFIEDAVQLPTAR